MSKTKESVAASTAVLDYLNRQNRPYSAVDVLNNLHKEYGKSAIVKALDTLVSENKIKSKSYNKQTVYVADQQQYPDVNEVEMKSMDAQLGELAQKLKESTDTCKQLDSELHQFSNAITTEEAVKQLSQLTADCNQLKDKLASLKSSVNTVSPKEREAILKARTSYAKEWRKRKRMSSDMLGAILEGYPKSKKEFLEEVGVETDEDLGVKLPDIT